LSVVAVSLKRTVEAIHVDVLNTFLGEQLAQRSKRAVLYVESLPYLPKLDLGELRQRGGTSRRGMVVAHSLVGEPEDRSIVRDLRPRIFALAEQIFEALLKRWKDVGFGLAQLIGGGFQDLHVTLSVRRPIRAAPVTLPTLRTPGASPVPATRA